jgi:hypothetical protein
MKVGIVQTRDIESKIEEALWNAKDRGETSITFLIQPHSLADVIKFLESNTAVNSVDIQNESLFLVKNMRISFELVDYYV